MLQAYRAQYRFAGIYLLPVNLYGPGDNFDPQTSHVIPALIRKFVDAKRTDAPHVEVWGTGTPSREFLYVDDCAEGILLASERYESPGPVNLGTGVEITIREVVERVKELTGYQGELRWNTSRPDGQPRRALDTRKARELFGFEAKVDFEIGLRNTVAWWEKEAS
jgi:GDP-L-fucose synthase